MGLDGLAEMDRLVAEGDVDVLVSGDDLGDVPGQAVEDGVGDEQPAEVVQRGMQRSAGGGVRHPGVCERGDEHLPDGA
ncbi:hypothetical protein AB0J57_32340 [Streptomyces sp. NPDC049837]|uniref:hypothetical protein n=1 Tax=Streptomyces sp. NPDC049837 TaxID=3155277 RepID=UPI003426F935